MQYDDVITNPRRRTDAILKIVFFAILGAVLADQREIWNRNEGSHADIGQMTKTAIFATSRWGTAAILKVALSPYLSRKLTNFDQIWWADVHMTNHIHADIGHVTKNGIFLKFMMTDGHHLENSFRCLRHCFNDNPVYFNRRTSFNEIMKTANIICINCTQSIYICISRCSKTAKIN